MQHYEVVSGKQQKLFTAIRTQERCY